MKIYSIYDNEFKKYGNVLEGDFSEILNKLKDTPRPEDKTTYCPSCKELECTTLKGEWEAEVYAGMCDGIKFSDDVMALYKKYGGPALK